MRLFQRRKSMISCFLLSYGPSKIYSSHTASLILCTRKFLNFSKKRNGFFSKSFFTQNLVFFRFSPIDEFIRHPSLSDFPNDLFCLIECIRNQIFLIFKIILSSFCLNHLKTSIKYCYTSFLKDSAPIYQHFKVIFRFIEPFDDVNYFV